MADQGDRSVLSLVMTAMHPKDYGGTTSGLRPGVMTKPLTVWSASTTCQQPVDRLDVVRTEGRTDAEPIESRERPIELSRRPIRNGS